MFDAEAMKNFIAKNVETLQTSLPSRETVKRALLRAMWAMIYGAIGGFLFIPVNLENPKQYIVVLAFAMFNGALLGLHKFVSGYRKYDLK